MLKADWQLGDRGHAEAHNAVARKLNRMIAVTDFGAVGDGATDDTQAFAAALLAAAGKTLRVPAGTYKLTAPLSIANGTRIVGDGRGCTTLTNAASDVFEWGARNGGVAHLGITASSGHVFRQTGATTHCLFTDLSITQQSNNHAVWSHTEDLGNYLFNTWLHYFVQHTYAATVATFHFVVSDSAGATNANLWQAAEHKRVGNYGFHFESKRESNYIYDNTLRGIKWSVPTGGCVQMLGCNNCVLENHAVYDLHVRPATNDLFVIGAGTSETNPPPSRHNELNRIVRIGQREVADNALVDIRLAPNGAYETWLQNCRNNVTGGLLIDYGGNAGVSIGCVSETASNDANIRRL